MFLFLGFTMEGKCSSKEELNTKDKPFVRIEDPEIPFTCSSCKMSETVQYKGTHPPFANNIKLLESSYVMRDPFQPRGKWKPEAFIVMGADCCICEQPVCKDTTCSFFYAKSFCIKCAGENIQKLPKEVQTKYMKQVS